MSLIVGTERPLLHPHDMRGPRNFAWGFVALEYYALVMNRVVAALVTTKHLVLVTAGGPVVASRTLSSGYPTATMYVSHRVVARYEAIDADADELIQKRRSNRRLDLSSITNVTFLGQTKWGMGTVPYSGLLLVTAGLKLYELILLGNQDGTNIQKKLMAAIRSGTA